MTKDDARRLYQRLLAETWKGDGTGAEAIVSADFTMHAAGTPVKFNGHEFFRFDKDRFVEYWGGADDAELMSQLGMFPKS